MAKLESQITNAESPPPTAKFDLESPTARFGESVARFAKSVPINLVTTPLVPQLVRSATSIGANYCEADDAGTRKEFLIASAFANEKLAKRSTG